MYAARYPKKVNALTLAGSPIDTDAGDGQIKKLAHTYPTSFYEELYRNIEDEEYRNKFEKFESWYEYTIDLPGSFYLQVVKELFKENKLVKGDFIGLGKKLSLKDIKCPVYLLAGERDDITPTEQVFNAEHYVGTDKKEIQTSKRREEQLKVGATILLILLSVLMILLY